MSNTALKPINLALQGGGAHGAYTWGVLDAILEDGRIDIDGLSATSAGSMNAAMVAYGKTLGGQEKARETLEKFWWEVSRAGAFYSPVQRSPWEMAQGMNPFSSNWALDNSATFNIFENFTHAFSPYQFNPYNVNPLRTVLENTIDIEQVHACKSLNLFVTATNVHTGTARIFNNKEITIDVLLASSCLPTLFQAVEIDGVPYWDGGYLGNPSLWPLFYHAKCRDILIVHINPIVRKETPKEAYEIENRLNEITFNSSLLKELRAIEFVDRLITEDMLKDEYKDRFKNILVHAIRADEVLNDLSIASKFDTSWQFLTHLRDLGREQGQNWLKANFKHINKKATVNIRKDYLG